MALTKTKTSQFKVAIPTADGAEVAYHVPIMITLEWDESVRDWFVTPESEELIESTKARYMGLLLPNEIRQIRERLQMTQFQLGDLLQIGEKSWTRWETGRQRPSRSINILLRALADGQIDADYLRRIRSPREPDWRVAIAQSRDREPLSMDRSVRSKASAAGTCEPGAAEAAA